MDNFDTQKSAKVGDVLFRYMRARHRFKDKVEHPLPAHELTALIDSGKVEFDEITSSRMPALRLSSMAKPMTCSTRSSIRSTARSRSSTRSLWPHGGTM